MRIVLAEDHEFVRKGVRAAVSAAPDVEIVAEVGNGTDALEAIARLRPDIAVVDIEMPGMSGIEVAWRLKDMDAVTSVVVLSVHSEESFVHAAMEAGVQGYILKEDAADDLLMALRSVARGETYLSPRVAGHVVRAALKGRPAEPPKLTPRERDVVRLLCEGLSSKEIAARLEISPRTVDGHRAQIMERLQFRGLAGLVKYAIRNHLTDLDDGPGAETASGE